MMPDFVAYLPCPIKVPFEQAVEEYLRSTGNTSITVQIEGNANKREVDYDWILAARHPDELPALLVTPGVNQLYSRPFLERIVDSGAYEDVADYPLSAARDESRLRDPLRHATVLAANVTVMVVDYRQLGTRSVPRAWRDLMAPELEGSVIMRGNGRSYCETTLLSWRQLLGAEKLKVIGRAIREGWHPAQMAKVAGSGSGSGAAVYVMPYFFARSIRNADQVEVIWPEEGAIASPVTLLAKERTRPEVTALAKFLAGKTIARLISHAGLPTPHPEVPLGLPVSAGYLWPDWSIARSCDLAEALAEAEAAFQCGQTEGSRGQASGSASASDAR